MNPDQADSHPSEDADTEEIPTVEVPSTKNYCLLGSKRVVVTPHDLVKGDKYFGSFYRDRLSEFRSGNFSLSRILMSVFKELIRSKGSFFRVSVPIQFIQPFSALELFSLTLCPTRRFLGLLSEENNAVRRLLAIVEWFLVNNVQNYFESFLHVKPFNPILGEVFACWWEEEEEEEGEEQQTEASASASTSTSTSAPPVCHMLAEQVSHHPPVSSFYFVSESPSSSASPAKLTIEATIRPKQKMYYNSGSLSTTGTFQIRLKLPNEVEEEIYTLDFPENLASGVFYGHKKIAPYGEAIIQCEKTHLTAKLTFSENGSLKGSIVHAEDARTPICEIVSEHATGEVHLRWNRRSRHHREEGEELLVDVGTAAANRKFSQHVREIRYQSEMESRRRWLKVSKNLLKGKNDRAAAAKKHIEGELRREAAERKSEGVVWSPKYFEGDLESNSMRCRLSDEEVRSVVRTRIVDPLWEAAVRRYLAKKKGVPEEEVEEEAGEERT